MHGTNKLDGSGDDISICSYPVGHEFSNYEEINNMAEFLESVPAAEDRDGAQVHSN